MSYLRVCYFEILCVECFEVRHVMCFKLILREMLFLEILYILFHAVIHTSALSSVFFVVVHYLQVHSFFSDCDPNIGTRPKRCVFVVSDVNSAHVLLQLMELHAILAECKMKEVLSYIHCCLHCMASSVILSVYTFTTPVKG